MRKAVSDSEMKNQNTAVDSLLVQGEDLVLQADIHNAIYWRACAILIFALLCFVFVAVELGIFFLIIAALAGIYAHMLKKILMLALTSKRVLARYGILQVDVVDIAFEKIESVELERMPPGYVFGYSNVVIMGTGQRHIAIPFVRNGIQFRKTFSEFSLKEK